MEPHPKSQGTFALALKTEIRRRWEESLGRIRKCVGLLSEEEIWRRPNAHTLTVGNILLHLSGNVRQWAVSALGGEKDFRSRDLEFLAERTAPKGELLEQLEATVRRAIEVLDGLEEKDLLEKRRVQGFEETGVAILVHVTEHLSYHTGQVTYIAKLFKDVDTAYYDSAKLRARNG